MTGEMPMTRVCHMSSVHPSDSTRIFHKECVSLAGNGYDTYFVACGESREDKGVHVVGTGPRSKGRLGRMLRDSRRVYKAALALNADVYHFHDPELLPYGVKLVRKGYKVIWDSHENYMDLMAHKSYLPAPVRKVAASLFRSYYKRVLPRFSAVIVASVGSRDLLQKVVKKAVIITNYPIVDEKAAEAAKPDYTSGKVVFAGVISPQWSHKETIQALDACPGVKYVLLGKGEGAFFESLQELPGWANVDFRGRVPFTEVPGILRECAAGMAVLKPSYNTHGSLGTIGVTKLFEEMAAGLPVICTDFTLWREIIDKYHCGILCDPSDPASIAEAIRTVTNDPALAECMGNAGKQAVLQEYNWKTQEKELLRLYEEVHGIQR